MTLHFIGTGHLRSRVTAPVWNVRIISSDFVGTAWPYWGMALIIGTAACTGDLAPAQYN